MRLLFDECLSPKLVEYFRSIINCTHVQELGLEGSSDREVYEWALKNDHVIATKNGKDFVRLMPNRRPGLIWLVDGKLTTGQQRKAMYAAIRYCEGGEEAWIKVKLVGKRFVCERIE
jgi:predicted nuclease of predicted toxin-antitoxin system